MTDRDMKKYIGLLSEARQGTIDDLNELLVAMDVGIKCMKEKKLRKHPIKTLEISCLGLHTEWCFVCPDCGKRVEVKDHFCRKCGQPLKWKW